MSDIIDRANDTADFNLNVALKNHQHDNDLVSAEWCDECGMEIPEARRIALPGVQLCVDCARAKETRERGYL